MILVLLCHFYLQYKTWMLMKWDLLRVIPCKYWCSWVEEAASDMADLKPCWG